VLPNPEIREVSIQDYLQIIRKRFLVILVFLIVIPIAVVVYDSSIKPVYRATVSIVIEKGTSKVTQFADVYQAGIMDIQFYQTQYKIMASRQLAERAFNDLRLNREADFRDEKDPVAKLQKMIKIEPVRNSQVVLINADDTDALRAASIANALAESYVKQDIELRNRATKEATGWLDEQAKDLQNKMRKSEEALNRYVQQNRIVTIPEAGKKMETLLDELKQSKSRIETDLAESSKRYGEKHPKLIALTAQLEDINKKIESETTRLLELNQKMVEYNMLRKEADTNQQLYTSLLQRAKETGVSEKIEFSNIRIVDAAKPPDVPFKPKKSRDLVLSIFLALFGGFGVAFFLEYLDSTIRTAEDVSHYLTLPFLGYIPAAHKEAKTDQERGLLCFHNPHSTTTESFRAVRTSVLFASPEDKPLKLIMITAAFPREGKSFFSSNLATIFSQVNEKIVVIDVDMRRPRLNKTFNLDIKPGLSNYLIGNVDLNSIIKPTTIPNLSIITSGTIPPNPSELLTSNKIRTLLEELKTKFDRIILDSPPILSAPDSSLLANVVDGVILVVKGASTRLEVVVKAKEKILEARGRIIGVVVNNIQPEREDRYYYYHYYYNQDEKKQK